MWEIAHIFWTIWEWSQILYLDEVTFQVGGKKCKQRCIRNKKERYHPDCIQFQMHRGGSIPVHFFGAVGYSYNHRRKFVRIGKLATTPTYSFPYNLTTIQIK